MVGCGSGKKSVAAQKFIVDQRRMVPSHNKLACLSFETYAPFKCFTFMFAPGLCVTVMDTISAANNQHALVPKARQLPAEFIVKLRFTRHIDLKLNHWHVRIGIDVTKNGPCAVI